jgi:hypothetical protein
LLLRVVSGRVPPGQLPDVKASIDRDYVPVAQASPGLERYLVGTWPLDAEQGDAIAYMTVWSDLDAAIAAVGGNLSALRLLDGPGHGEVLERVDYYEVDIADAHRIKALPRYLRLTAGTVGRGLDADIQRELRSRLTDLAPEIVDAYIGRRVKGASVEIAFVSTWTEAADDETLQKPVWPHIATQYDTFWVKVFDVLSEGSPKR